MMQWLHCVVRSYQAMATSRGNSALAVNFCHAESCSVQPVPQMLTSCLRDQHTCQTVSVLHMLQRYARSGERDNLLIVRHRGAETSSAVRDIIAVDPSRCHRRNLLIRLLSRFEEGELARSNFQSVRELPSWARLR